MREFIINYISTDFKPIDGPIKYPPTTLPFIDSIKSFFISGVLTDKYTFETISPVPIRRELFKLYYLSDLFNLNEKSDAAEALAHVLSLLHASQCDNLGCIPFDEKNEHWKIDFDASCSKDG